MHKCVRCGKKFEHLSDDLLRGCPECGGRLFLYVRDEDPFLRIHGIEGTEDEMEEIEEMISDEQIEGLRILGPGVYELNLSSLLQRKEIILKLRNEGTYAIHLPSLFGARRKRR